MGPKNPRIADRNYLLTEQYPNASNLNARIQLHRRFSTNKYGWPRWVFEQIHLSSKSHILELGCGPGNLWLENSQRIPEGWKITLSDLSLGMVQKAQQNLERSWHPFRFGVVDAQSISFGDESFDAVIANHMLYHVPDRAKAFEEIRRVLRPGGRFYASTVGRDHLQELYELVRRFDSSADPWGERPAEPFLLENGLDQIGRWFPKVSLRRYKDALVVTKAEPLVAYVVSAAAKSNFVGEKLAEFTRFVEQELLAHGAIHVTKDTGLFEAWQGGRA
ncbi:MAG: class I SAM-dependent methyltransferase [Anaerolineae bacterium]|nr:MAG: class I SAM-dependent methyltransferase [Anaerolineae bacterium]